MKIFSRRYRLKYRLKSIFFRKINFKIKDKKRFFLFLGISVSVFIFISGLGFYFFAKHQIYTPLSQKANSKTFSIKPGDGSEEIAKKLEKQGLISDNLWFDIYAFLKGMDSKLKAGDYVLSPSMSIPEIVKKISSGETTPSEIKITVPEGFRLNQIDKRLADKNLIKRNELASTTPADIDFSDLGFKTPTSTLEGYLFPDTYMFDLDAKADMIASKMLQNFNKKLTPELKREIEDQGKTINEIVTMASIIEKEVPTYYEKRIVSGIFWKRIKNGYPLQSCATIAYALGEDKWRYSLADLEVDSPYNTYKNEGLPLTPICNPGLSSIKAAIYPKQTSYNFFLSKPNGQTLFSVTGAEHEKKKEKYLK